MSDSSDDMEMYSGLLEDHLERENMKTEQKTDLVTQQNQPINYDAQQIAIIKNSFAIGATDLELAMFLAQCKRTGLDCMTRQIYFIKDSKGKVQIQTSVDGFRLIAERSDKYEGQTKAEWCDYNGKWVDVWLSQDLPAAARVGVFKKGFREPVYGTALFEEYAQRYPSGELGFMWGKMPALMIAKVAECLAIRKAFPNDLSGIYAAEEMAQVENLPPAAPKAEPPKGFNAGAAVKTAEPSFAPSANALPPCEACHTTLALSKAGAHYYCPNIQKASMVEGVEHSKFTVDQLGPYKVYLEKIRRNSDGVL